MLGNRFNLPVLLTRFYLLFLSPFCLERWRGGFQTYHGYLCTSLINCVLIIMGDMRKEN